MRRGEIYWAELRPRSGSEQQGRRPVIVVSHDAFNATPNWRSVIVLPISTSPKQATRGPTAIALSKGSGGLPADSAALCHQVTTLDREKLAQRLGSLNTQEMARIDAGIKAAMDLG